MLKLKLLLNLIAYLCTGSFTQCLLILLIKTHDSESRGQEEAAVRDE